ncbi:putative holin [Chitiniphilus eburneus]|uniref:putative holin n=1 Tax=Chitiniphilus eburneus TaxID=2571148 RepID=UPI0035CF10E1
MAEPVASTSAWALLVGMLGITAVSGDQAGIVLGAWAGAMAFVTVRTEMSLRARAWQGVLSWLLGMIGASTATRAVAKITVGAIEPTEPVGAIVAAALSLVLIRSAMKWAERGGQKNAAADH